MAFGEEILFHRPREAEEAIISILKSYLVHFGGFVFSRKHCWEIRGVEEKCTKPYSVVVSIPTNGPNVAFKVVIWLSFLSIKFLQTTIYLCWIGLNGKCIKKVQK